jgi:hypothetical protein
MHANNGDYNNCYYLALNAGTIGTPNRHGLKPGQSTDGRSREPGCTWKASHEYGVGLIRPTQCNGYFLPLGPRTEQRTEPTWLTKGSHDGTVTWLTSQVVHSKKHTNGLSAMGKSEYTAQNPTVDRTISLIQPTTLHSTSFFSAATASGGATQKADVWKFVGSLPTVNAHQSPSPLPLHFFLEFRILTHIFAKFMIWDKRPL